MKLHWLMHSVSGPIALKPFFFFSHFHPFCQCVLGALLIYVKQLKACGLGKVRRAGKDKDNTRVRTPFSSCSFLVNLRLLTAAIGCPGGYNHTCLSLPSLIFFSSFLFVIYVKNCMRISCVIKDVHYIRLPVLSISAQDKCEEEIILQGNKW